MGSGAPSVLTIGKIGVESGYGAGTTTLTVPITGGGASGLYEPILDQGKRGIPARDFGSYKGPARAEASLEGDAFKDVIDILKASIIGSGGSLSSSPSTLGMILSGGSGAAHAKGLGVTELTLRWSRAEGPVTYSASMLGQKAVKASTLSAAHDVGKPLVGWKTVVTVGEITGCSVEGELSLSRPWALLYCGTGDDAAFPSNAYAGPLEVTGRLTVDFSTSADLDVAFNKEQGDVTIAFADEDGSDDVTATMPEVDFSDGPVEIDHSGEFITLVFSIRAVYDTDAESGPISIA